jgi:hypothetical protein
MSGHTPGPWKRNYRRVTPVNAKQDGAEDICHVYGDEDKEIANGNLIAAAPDLLDAVSRFVALHNAEHESESGEYLQSLYDEAIGAARAALAKASERAGSDVSGFSTET